MALGVDRAILLQVEDEWDAQATTRAIVEAVNAEREAGTAFDLIFFGNESADSGNYQVGIRVAHALGMPCVTGVKAICGRRRPRSLRAGDRVRPRRLRRAAAGGGDRQGGPQPAPLPVGAGSAEGQAQAARDADARAARGRRPEAAAQVCRPARASRPRSSATGRTPRPRWSRCCARRGWSRDAGLRRAPGGRPDDASLQAIAVARQLAAGGPVHAMAAGPGAADTAAALGGHGVATVHVAEHDALATHAPAALAAA